MAYKKMNYQYETSPRKLQPTYKPEDNPYKKKKTTNAKNNKQQSKKHNQSHTKAIIYIVVGFIVLFAISYRNSLITESFNRKEELKKQLSTMQKENNQLKISIQNSLNLSNIEKSASSKLGMKKLDDTQKVYINLPKKDYIELASEQVVTHVEKNWFQKIIDKIIDLI